MLTQISDSSPAPILVKEQLTVSLRDAILQGRLAPGQRVIEGNWAREFGVAQASVREAINALIVEGFLVKDAGRSARVVRYGEENIFHIYQVREALEGHAARLAVENHADLKRLEGDVGRMSAAFDRADMPSLIESDLDFHLAIAEASGNPQLIDLIRRMLVPFFAFVRLRITDTEQLREGWSADLPRHRRIVELLAEGDPEIAAQYMRHCIRLFADTARLVWATSVPAQKSRKRARL